jgi:NAD(P)-dependent dehydrogenase (short-subunit alcohol dehydrogenase family)
MRSIVITGVSRGLGAALFDEFHAAGDRILALGRRFTPAQHQAERSEPQRVRLRLTDLAHPSALPGAAELGSFVHDASQVVLVHNAGVLEPVGAIGALAPDQIQYAMTVNVISPMVLTNAMIGTGVVGPATAIGTPASAVSGTAARLTVLFISSGAAHATLGGWSVYSAAKRAGETFFEALAAQHADDPRVRVVNVQPGVIDTDMQATVRRYAGQHVYFPDGARFVAAHERGQLPRASEVARQIIGQHLSAPIMN